MGIIDTHSDYSLYDIVNGDLGFADLGNGYPEPEGSIDFYGIHVFPANDSGEYILQYDGHVGEIDTIDADDYDDVLELVSDLLSHVFELDELTKAELVEYAGEIMTHDEERAEEEPDLYQHVPEGF